MTLRGKRKSGNHSRILQKVHENGMKVKKFMQFFPKIHFSQSFNGPLYTWTEIYFVSKLIHLYFNFREVFKVPSYTV